MGSVQLDDDGVEKDIRSRTTLSHSHHLDKVAHATKLLNYDSKEHHHSSLSNTKAFHEEGRFIGAPNGRLKDAKEPKMAFESLPNGHIPENSTSINEASAKDSLEPIAVIGLSLRFPQDATSADSFWQMLMDARSARTDVPKDRFNIDSFYHSGSAGSSRSGVTNARGGHFIKEDLAAFDAPFFSITPSEAECMDPSQRWLLETTYEALENAGLPIQEIAGSKTSVHMGAFLREYELLLSRDPQMQQKHKATGTAFSMLANRLSWFFNLMGPSLVVDTACSSSLYALHLACQSLRSGDSTMGIVGGCNLFYNPEAMTAMSDLNFLSPDSICYSFDHRANGYARGEGLGVVIIKTLSAAINDGDTIRAVIRATGANQDGRTPGITQPSSYAQEQLIRDTYAAAGLDLSHTRYFEAHGTGTPVGDPLEASAIQSTFSEAQCTDVPLFVGAVKSSIGHLEGAAGIAGFIKTVLVLEQGIIPPNIWFERANPKIVRRGSNIKFPTIPTPWPTDGLRRASVNSFGFGGSNAHAVLDDAFNALKDRGLQARHCTHPKPPKHIGLLGKPLIHQERCGQSSETRLLNGSTSTHHQLFVWSAAEENGLERLSNIYAQHIKAALKTSDPVFLADLAYTLSEKRSRLPWKAFTVADTVERLSKSLSQGLSTPVRSNRALNLGYVFTGQGAQWYAMGRELMEYPVFRDAMNDADLFFRRLDCPWSLVDELAKDVKKSRLSEPALSQPACTAVQIALVELLSSWNVFPAAVVGHSSGEIAAAYCTGGLDRNSAWKVAYCRGLVAESLKRSAVTDMGMLSVGLSETDVREYLQAHNLAETVTIACINSPRNVTLSGDLNAIDALASALQLDNTFARKLEVDIAYHSKYMNGIALAYEALLDGLRPGTALKTQPTMCSSVTGRQTSIATLGTSSYWVRNMVSPVRFLEAVSQVCSDPSKNGHATTSAGNLALVDHLVEIGPHSALRGPLRDILKSLERERSVGYSSMLVRFQSAAFTALEVAGTLVTAGYAVNIATVNERGSLEKPPRMLTNLPAYPFNHSKKYWLESRMSENLRFRSHPDHELLGTPVPDWNPLHARWRNIISLDEQPWIKDHKVNGLDVYPAAGMVVMAIEAARQLAGPEHQIRAIRLKNVSFINAIVWPSRDAKIETEFHLLSRKEEAGGFLTWNDFRLFTHGDDSCSESCSGKIALEHYPIPPDELSNKDKWFQEISSEFKTAAQRCTTSVASSKIYDQFEGIGLAYGPSFQGLKSIRCSNAAEATAQIDLREWMSKVPDSDVQQHVIHPAPLDTVLQLALVAMSNGTEDTSSTMIPQTIHDLWISTDNLSTSQTSASSTRPEDMINIHAQTIKSDLRSCESSITAVDATSGMPRIVGSLRTISITQLGDASTPKAAIEPIAYHLLWKPDLDLLERKEIVSYCNSRVASSKFPPALTFKVSEKLLYCSIRLWQTHRSTLSEGTLINNVAFAKYAEWMEHRLSDVNLGPELSQCRLEQLANDDEYVQRLERTVDECDPEGRLMVAVGRKLRDILRGDTDALEVLFKDRIVNDYYRFANNAFAAFGKLNAYIDTLAHKIPGMKILEIGAGTGAATIEIIQTLVQNNVDRRGSHRFSEYVFTDISPSFFDDASELFKDLTDRMTFSVLDISKDPIEQGFKAGTYDLVIASNVLHATPNLAVTLRNTQALLKPGGKLALYELVQPDSVRNGFIFGLLPGWWLSSEENRRWSPLMSEPDWDTSLSRQGFSGVDLALRDFDDEEDNTLSAMVSTAVKDHQDPDPPPNSQTFILSTDLVPRARLVENLASLIQERVPRAITLSDIDGYDFSAATCIFLPDAEDALLRSPRTESFARMQKVICSAKETLWVTEESLAQETNPIHGMVNGLRRVVSREVDDIKFATLSLRADQEPASQAEYIVRVLKKIQVSSGKEIDLEYRVSNEGICVPRLLEANRLNQLIAEKETQQAPAPIKFGTGHSRALKLSTETLGSLDSLHFEDDDNVSNPLADSEIEIKVAVSGLNFKDVLAALGQVPDNNNIGIECAGFVSRTGPNSVFEVGDRVCAVVDASFCTYARCDANHAVAIPNDITFHEAAALPIVYPTAYYSLMHLARMKPKESVLIHSGAGGLGQASIQLAKLLDAEIFTTVGSTEKKQFLMDQYNIREDHIFSSRSGVFVQEIKRMTKGRGVDVIVNSLAGQGLKDTWECIAPFGRFIETSKKDSASNGDLPMTPFARGASFAAVDLIHIKNHAKEIMRDLLRDTMALMTEKKIAAPAPLQVFSVSRIEEAFRLLQSGKSKGKIVVELQDDDIVQATPSRRLTNKFDSNATYVMSGGFGGLGRSIAQQLADRGASNLILLSRHGENRSSSKEFCGHLRAQGVSVAAPVCDITDQELLARALEDCCNSMPPIRGCVQGAMVLKDSRFDEMTVEDFNASVDPKVTGSWNLHELLPRDLDFFIMLSSSTGIIGWHGQSNYASGNTYQDALARHLVATRSRKAVSLDLGGLRSAGYVANKDGLAEQLESQGVLVCEESVLHTMLDYYCDPNLDLSDPAHSQVVAGVNTPARLEAQGIDVPSWMYSPLFSHLFQIQDQSVASAANNGSPEEQDFGTRVKSLTTHEDIAAEITLAIRVKLAKTLAIDKADIDTSKPMHSYGVDSLAAAEIRSWMKRTLGCDVAVFDILGDLSIEASGKKYADRCELVTEDIKKAWRNRSEEVEAR